MTLPTGTISFKQLAAEYNQPSTNISLGAYYYGGTILKSNSCTDVIRTNGTNFGGYNLHFKDISVSQNNISLRHYKGKSYYYARTNDIIVGGSDVSISIRDVESESPKTSAENSAYFNVITNANIIATTTNQPACKLYNAGRPNSAVLFTNNHTIYGKGGNGGRGHQNGSNGGNGGTALRLQGNSFVVNNGNIWGGGGGGGGGDSRRVKFYQRWGPYGASNETNYSASGSGGGGGAGGGTKGNHGDRPQGNFGHEGANGQDGNYNNNNAYGNGGGQVCGSGGGSPTVCSGEGGRGGDWGERGVNAGTSGGSGGFSITRESSIYYKLITQGSLKGGQTTV